MASHDLLVVRTVMPADYPRVLGVVDEWWGGRPADERTTEPGLLRALLEH